MNERNMDIPHGGIHPEPETSEFLAVFSCGDVGRDNYCADGYNPICERLDVNLR